MPGKTRDTINPAAKNLFAFRFNPHVAKILHTLPSGDRTAFIEDLVLQYALSSEAHVEQLREIEAREKHYAERAALLGRRHEATAPLQDAMRGDIVEAVRTRVAHQGKDGLAPWASARGFPVDMVLRLAAEAP